MKKFKIMKTLNRLFLALFVIAIAISCENSTLIDDSEDILSGGATLATIVELSDDSGGKLLGVPSSLDFETATVGFAEYELFMEVKYISGGDNVVGYEITKSLNGGTETTVAQSSTLPFSLEYSTLEEFLSGLGVADTDLRIGDQIIFRTKMILDDGREVYAASGDGSVVLTVNCSSNLAGTYDVEVHYIRASSGIDTYYYYQEVITETAPGEYRTYEVGPWINALGGGLGVGTPGYTFTDTCGSITVPEQNLLEFYSNLVEGAGSVDGVTGVLTIDYTICASDCREVYAIYTPVP